MTQLGFVEQVNEKLLIDLEAEGQFAYHDTQLLVLKALTFSQRKQLIKAMMAGTKKTKFHRLFTFYKILEHHPLQTRVNFLLGRPAPNGEYKLS